MQSTVYSSACYIRENTVIYSIKLIKSALHFTKTNCPIFKPVCHFCADSFHMETTSTVILQSLKLQPQFWCGLGGLTG